MSTRSRVAAFATVCACALGALFLVHATAAVAQDAENDEVPWSTTGPKWVGPEYFSAGEFAKLEALATELLRTRARTIDGRFQLSMLEAGLGERLSSWTTISPGAAARLLARWDSEQPTSAYQPIIAAMNIQADAWAARGEGAASTVTPDGWKVFHERNEAAWSLLRKAKQRAAVFPAWYHDSLSLAFEMSKPLPEIKALFDEGIARYPGYYPLYFTYLNYLAPKWGGDFQSLDQFIREQVAAPTNPDGDMLYARMYWFVDECDTCGDRKYFENSLVKWPRMRAGFEEIMRQFPKSRNNLAAFASFACRAKDGATYAKLRAVLNDDVVRQMAIKPDLAKCDALFRKGP